MAASSLFLFPEAHLIDQVGESREVFHWPETLGDEDDRAGERDDRGHVGE